MLRNYVIYSAAIAIAAAVVSVAGLYCRSIKQSVDKRVDAAQANAEGIVETDRGSVGIEVSAVTFKKIAMADMLIRFSWPLSIACFVIAIAAAKFLSNRL